MNLVEGWEPRFLLEKKRSLTQTLPTSPRTQGSKENRWFEISFILRFKTFTQVLNYYARFTRVGDPLKSPIDQTEFLEIMQVSND